MDRLIAKIKDLDRKKLIITGLVAMFLIYKLVFVGGLGIFDRGNLVADETGGVNDGTNTRANDRFLANNKTGETYNGYDSNGSEASDLILSPRIKMVKSLYIYRGQWPVLEL